MRVEVRKKVELKQDFSSREQRDAGELRNICKWRLVPVHFFFTMKWVDISFNILTFNIFLLHSDHFSLTNI
jgi:hypothetical protein